MTEQFKAGDKVRLKSGSPVMMVDGYDMAGRVICTWWDGKAPKQHCFTQETLEAAKDEPHHPPAASNPSARQVFSG